jgi:hypothetical protein
MSESNFWKYQPIIPKKNQKPYTIIGNIPPFIGTNNMELNIYRFNMKYFDDIFNFINNNYIRGYRLLPDYLRRKLAITNSHAFVLCDKQCIVGFIYSQPLLPTNLNIEPMHYVDLLTILHSHRKKGYANILISAMANFAGTSRVFIHKKDEKPLMFPYFYRSRHYSASIPFLIDKYRKSFVANNDTIINTERAYQIYEHECGSFKYKNPIDVFHTSSSVQTHIFRDRAVVSFAIFEFGINTNIAEIFYVSLEFNNDDYIQLIHILHQLNIQLIVSLPYRFFKLCIEKDSYMESMELFIHSYNMYIPEQTETEIDAIIPFIAF